MPMRAPCQEFRNLKIGDLLRALFDDEVVDGDEAGGGETEFGEHQIDAVHSEGEFVFKFGEVGLLEGGTITNDEGALTRLRVRVLERGEATDALAPPRMQVRGRELRQATNPVVGVFGGLEEGGGEEDGLFHSCFVCWGCQLNPYRKRLAKATQTFLSADPDDKFQLCVDAYWTRDEVKLALGTLAQLVVAATFTNAIQ